MISSVNACDQIKCSDSSVIYIQKRNKTVPLFLLSKDSIESTWVSVSLFHLFCGLLCSDRKLSKNSPIIFPEPIFNDTAMNHISSLQVVTSRFHYSPNYRNMDLISWGLNIFDTIFSTREQAWGEPQCPHRMLPSGYMMDGSNRWRILCLTTFSVEDIEDVYIFAAMTTGFLLTGLGFALIRRGIQKMLRNMDRYRDDIKNHL